MNRRTSALDALIFGVDVQSGDIRGDAPSYALVIFDGEESSLSDSPSDTFEREVVSRRKLLRLVEDQEPAIIATDNMYELAEDKDNLIHLLRKLPNETTLVQVTGDENPEPLSRVASRHGVPYSKEPMKEAEAAARLAAKNIGYEVSAFTNTTKIKVSRGRSTGKGGWSEDRYTRRIHGAVKKATRSVESTLNEQNLDFDKDVTEKYGGYSRAEFTVEAPPSEIPVSNERSGDVRIEVNPVQRDGIEFSPLVTRRDPVIVGIDPGTTTAVALSDLDGNILDVWSSRMADTGEVIEWIIDHGRPVLIAADVTPMPETVEKIRRSFNAAGWTPQTDLPIDEKQHRTRQQVVENDHERDAMAAALYAYDDHHEQFDTIARKTPAQLNLGEVVQKVIGEETALDTVIEELTETTDQDTTEPTEQTHERSPEERRIDQLETQVERLQDKIDDLEDKLDEKNDKIDEYERELSEARRQERKEARERREVARLERKNEQLRREREEAQDTIANLEDKIERLKVLWKLDHSNFSDIDQNNDLVPIKPVEKFTVEALEAANDTYGLAQDDVVYLRDATGAGQQAAEYLANISPKIVLIEGGLTDISDQILFDNEIPIGSAEEVTIREVDELAVARESEVQNQLDSWKEWADRRRRAQKQELVDKLISEHRSESGKSDV
ncbi:MAG: DUF460 domain-containing protein [Halobacteriaceae archaeon]